MKQRFALIIETENHRDAGGIDRSDLQAAILWNLGHTVEEPPPYVFDVVAVHDVHEISEAS